MLFKPSYNLNIIPDSQFLHKMTQIDKLLKKYVNEGTFEGFDKSELFYEYYLAQNSKASVVIIHGFTEFSKKYHELIWYFLNAGFNVFVYDQRGHGLSPRKINDLQLIHVDRFEDYVEDLREFVNQIVIPNSKDIPVNIFSHSMGGGVTSMYLEKYNTRISKAVLSAPMICPVAGNIPRFYLKAFLVREAKKHGWTHKFKFMNDYNPNPKFEFSADLSQNRFLYNLNTRNKDRRYQNSPSTVGWLYEALSIQEKILNRKKTAHITAKTLIITASQDNVVKRQPQLKLAKLIPNCKYFCINGAKHSLYTAKAPMLKQYMKKIIDFYNS